MSGLSETQQKVLNSIVAHLKDIHGVRALVLGGSYATGRNNAMSDVDVGVYYSEKSPLDIAGVRDAVAKIAAGVSCVVTGLYEWGPWVNGGSWMDTSAGRFDLLYRNIEQVEKTLHEGNAGIIHHHYLQQPPFGFTSVIYLAETFWCKPLWDPQGDVARLKELVKTYSPALKRKQIHDNLANAEFTLANTDKSIAQGDSHNIAGCLSRVFLMLIYTIYAINEVYFMADKSVPKDLADRLPRAPKDFWKRMTQIISHIGATPEELQRSTNAARQLWIETVALTDSYKPRFAMGEVGKSK